VKGVEPFARHRTSRPQGAWIKVCEYALSNELKKLDAFLESDRGKLLIEVLTKLGYKALLDTLITDAKLRQKIVDLGGN
jgi:hypothetical protein